MKNKYKSKFEKRIADQLKKARVKFEYEKVSYKYASRVRTAAFCVACKGSDIEVVRSYTPDFFLSNGVIIETKGKWTTVDRYKMLDVRASNPEVEIRMLFMSDNKINRASTTRYSNWCAKNGITYAVGRVPESWYEIIEDIKMADLNKQVVALVKEYLYDKDMLWDYCSEALERVMNKKDIKAQFDAIILRELGILLKDPNLVKRLAIKQILNRKC